MLAFFQRLLLGLLLIAAASAVLLFSDLGTRTHARQLAAMANEVKGGAETATPNPARKMRIALLQHASQAPLDAGRDGVVEGLAEKGWIKGQNLEVTLFNAQGDMPVAQAIAKQMVSGNYDLLLTVSTPSMQAVANANKEGGKRHVFGLVTDPYGAGVGISRTNHLEHPAHLAGYATMQPVELAFKTAREMNPSLARVGVIWNAAESNSEAQVKLARAVSAQMKLSLVEATVDNTAGVGEAANALVARDVDAIWVGGDVTVIGAVDTVIAAAHKGHIPVFTVIPPNAKRGALFDVGADYHEVGRLTGLLAGDILNGRDPASVSIDNVMPELLIINRQALAGLNPGWSIPAAIANRAQVVIDEHGVEHSKALAAQPAADRAKPMAAPGRTYHLAFASFSPEPSLEACQRGLLEGLRDFGFVEGKNLTIAQAHAQGEMVNIAPMIQNFDHSDADVLVTFTTPVTQGAIMGAKLKPVVFTYVTDPIAAGVGTSFEEHNSHITGVGSLPPVDDTLRILLRALPKAKTLGTLYNSGEANSRKVVSILRVAAKKYGLDLIELTAASSNEVVQATQGLITRHVDAIYIPSDNTAYLAFDGIIKFATEAKIPVVIDDPDSLDHGAFLCCGPGFYYSGKAAAEPLARVLCGESPAKIPLANVSVNVTKFNRATIAKLGLQIAPELLAELETSSTPPAVPPATTAAANPNPTGKKWKIALVTYNETSPCEQTLEGMEAAWKRSSLVKGRDYEITLRSAQGDMGAISGIIDAALTERADIIVPICTPALQVAVQKVKTLPIVFSLVANPMAAGAGQSYTDHLPNVTGISVLAPFDEALDVIQQHFPTYKRLGTIYCPAEANSVDLKQQLEAACHKRGLTLEVVAANTATDLADAALLLMGRPIDAVLQLSDNLTSAGFTAITRAARQTHTPLLSLNSTMVPLGAPFAMGRDYFDGGEATVAMLERVIRGEDPGIMPFELPPRVVMKASEDNARAIGMTLPPALLEKVAASNAKRPSAAPAEKPTAGSPVPAKKWKIALILYNETPPAEETLAGMKTAWSRSAFKEGRDYQLKTWSAQGDMGMLNGIFDAALTDGADLIVTLSTPTLQAAITKVKRVPIVFTLVTNPMAAGAGQSYTAHLPNVSGIAVLAPMGEALDMIRKHFPAYHRLGTLYCPAEANAVYLKEALAEECQARGFTLETVAANSASELPDAARALMARPIDAVLQIPDALSSSGFTAIARAARQTQKPLLALTSTVIPQGAAVAIGRDFHDAGEATVALIERLFRGEKVADIPFMLPPHVVFAVNPANAAAVGMTLPPGLLKEPSLSAN